MVYTRPINSTHWTKKTKTVVNGGYYIDYAGMIGTMGLPVMHHKMWDGLVSLVGSHAEQLAKCKYDMVRDNIEMRGNQGKWMAS